MKPARSRSLNDQIRHWMYLIIASLHSREPSASPAQQQREINRNGRIMTSQRGSSSKHTNITLFQASSQPPILSLMFFKSITQFIKQKLTLLLPPQTLHAALTPPIRLYPAGRITPSTWQLLATEKCSHSASCPVAPKAGKQGGDAIHESNAADRLISEDQLSQDIFSFVDMEGCGDGMLFEEHQRCWYSEIGAFGCLAGSKASRPSA